MCLSLDGGASPFGRAPPEQLLVERAATAGATCRGTFDSAREERQLSHQLFKCKQSHNQ